LGKWVWGYNIGEKRDPAVNGEIKDEKLRWEEVVEKGGWGRERGKKMRSAAGASPSVTVLGAIK